MLDAIVVDTNVLVDAGNPSVITQGEAIEFCKRFGCTELLLGIDNRGLIKEEYCRLLTGQTFGYQFYLKLLKDGRITEISLPNKVVKQKILRLIKHNKRDRTFLGIATVTALRVLVTHDRRDFSIEKRREILAEIQVDVVSALDGLRYL